MGPNMKNQREKKQEHVTGTCEIPVTHQRPKYCVYFWTPWLWIKAVWIFPVNVPEEETNVFNKRRVAAGEFCYFSHLWHRIMDVFLPLCVSEGENNILLAILTPQWPCRTDAPFKCWNNSTINSYSQYTISSQDIRVPLLQETENENKVIFHEARNQNLSKPKTKRKTKYQTKKLSK